MFSFDANVGLVLVLLIGLVVVLGLGFGLVLGLGLGLVVGLGLGWQTQPHGQGRLPTRLICATTRAHRVSATTVRVAARVEYFLRILQRWNMVFS